jgi:hypothetical protein
MRKTFILLALIEIIFGFSILQAATLEGKCIDSYTHKPIAGVVITVEDHNNLYAVSDATGNFKIENLGEGRYRIHAISTGYDNSYTQDIIISASTQVLKYDIYMKPESVGINEVQVLGNAIKESDASARQDERLAPNVINIVSAKTIEALPDQNVADILQRVSGVSMTKNSMGSNSNVIIRGMPVRYNSSMVDGVVLPTTSASGRSVSLDMFGSELVGRIEVIKALTADLEGDAIGGVVNIRMKQAPDTAYIKAEAGSGYNQYYFNHSFLTFNNSTVAAKDFAALNGPNFLADASLFPRKNLIVQPIRSIPDLNFYLSGGRRFLDKRLGVMVAFNAQTTSLANTYDLTSYFLDPNTSKSTVEYWESEVFSKMQKRYGGYAKIDYRFNENHQISLYSSFFQLNEQRVRQYTDLQNDNGAANYRPIASQTINDNSGISTISMRGDHILSDIITLDWTLIYAGANSNSPDFAVVTQARLGNNPPTLNYSQPVVRNWQWDFDENKSGYLNLTFKPTLFGHLFEFKAGGMARDKYRKNYMNEYFFDCPKPQKYPYPDLDTVPLTNNQNKQQKKGNAYLNPNNYRAWENDEAAYAMLNTHFGKLQLQAGFRMEFTYMRTSHNQGNVKVPVTGDTVQYRDPLLDLHLTYKITEQQNLRFSIYQAINRQNFIEIIPSSDPRPGSIIGRPGLKHATGNCFDMRYEFYPQAEEVFSAGVFYKKLTNPIEELPQSGSDTKYFQNVGSCTNYGLELVVMKYFGNFGFSGNYTYTRSKIIVPTYFQVYKNGIYDTTINKYETRPLAGQSQHLVNLGISYRNLQWGFRANISYTLQGKNIVIPGDTYERDIYQADYHNLGFSIDQKIGKRIVIVVKASNLLNSPIVRYIYSDGSQIEKAYNYQNYYIGLKLNL